MGVATLGLGSSGVLNNDLIDKLKSADEAAVIRPIEQRQTEINLKQQALREVKKLLNDLSDLSVNMSDRALYQSTKSNIIGDSATITTNGNAKKQSFSIDVEQLATRDIRKTKAFDTKDGPLGESGEFDLKIAGQTFHISYSEDDSLEDLGKRIEETTGGLVKTSILNTGESKPYRLILKSRDTGTDNNIVIPNGGHFTFYSVQDAQDAKFKIDGIEVTRGSNSFDDVYEGVNITLKSTGLTKIEVEKDSDKIADKMSEFVDKYNSVIETITNLTKFDKDKKVAGVLQGSSEIRSIKSKLRDIFESTFGEDGKMANDYGLTTDKKGIISFDRGKFISAIKEDPTAVENFFVGKDDTKGIFRKFNTTLFEVATKSSGELKSLQSSFDDRAKAIADSLKKAREQLENRYEILTKKFASFDMMIGNLSNTASQLDSLIQSQFSKK